MVITLYILLVNKLALKKFILILILYIRIIIPVLFLDLYQKTPRILVTIL